MGTHKQSTSGEPRGPKGERGQRPRVPKKNDVGPLPRRRRRARRAAEGQNYKVSELRADARGNAPASGPSSWPGARAGTLAPQMSRSTYKRSAVEASNKPLQVGLRDVAPARAPSISGILAPAPAGARTRGARQILDSAQIAPTAHLIPPLLWTPKQLAFSAAASSAA